MSLANVASRDRRALFFGAVAVMAGVSWVAIVKPYMRAVQNTSTRLAAERELLGRELRLLAAADEYPLVVDQAGDHLLEVASRLFSGDSPAMASARLIRYVQEAARPAPALITRLEPIPAEEEGNGLLGLPLRVEGETDLEGLLTMLHALDAGPKLVWIDDLRIQGSRTATSDGPEVLSFEFVARGLSLAMPEVRDERTESGGGFR